MKRIIGIVLLIVGVLVFIQGMDRKNSIVGAASSAGTSIANSVDGGARTPQHVVMMVAGGAIALVGLVLTVRPGRT